MIALENLSKIGLGTYRMAIDNENHVKSFDYAVKNGINLIDTASNYTSGNSEKLIGQYIKTQRRGKIFVVSKAGYIQRDDLKTFSSYLDNENCVKNQNGFYYSLEKSFLEKQLNFSLKRLNTDFLDGFLIHNPEYYLLDQGVSKSHFYHKIKESLHFLESLVKDGLIRYYGISSNKLPTGEVDIKEILGDKSDFPNFKLLQFPYNFIENEASKMVENESLLDFCKKNDIRTFINRPLTTIYNKKVLRIADYSKEMSNIDFTLEESLFNNFISKISTRLKDIDPEAEPTDFTALKIIIDKRKEFANPEAVDRIVNGHLLPLVDHLKLLDNQKLISDINDLTFYWKSYAKKSITKRALDLKKDLITSGELNEQDRRDLSLIASEKYLKDGVDHVLVGMRKIQYIDKLKTLF